MKKYYFIVLMFCVSTSAYAGLFAAVDYPSGVVPSSITINDFNGDNVQDIAVASSRSSTSPQNISIRLGVGDGTFNTETFHLAGRNADELASADFNNDGVQDIIDAGRDLDILLGVGDGTFNAPTRIATAIHARALTVADFNGDGNLDLAIHSSGSLNIYLGVGDGTFNNGRSLSSGSSASIISSDFNGDGVVDIVVGRNLLSNNYSVFLGLGDGTFAAEAIHPLGIGVWSIANADFNADGIQDLVAGSDTGVIGVMLGVGDGTFAYPVEFIVGTTLASLNVQDVISADISGDGIQDIVVRSYLSNKIKVFNGVGDGTFDAVVTYDSPAYIYSLESADFNGNGVQDVAAGYSYFSQGISVFLAGSSSGSNGLSTGASGGGCTINSSSAFDPIMILTFLLATGLMLRRYRNV